MLRKLLIVILFSLLISTIISAQNYGVGVKLNTLGFNADVYRSFNKQLTLRAGFSYFSITLDGGGGTDEYIYDADASMNSLSLLLDYFPGGSSFRLTGGVLVNLNEADLNLVPNETYTIGGDVYTPDKIGTLKANIKFNKVAPYFSLGVGNPMSGPRGLKFFAELGTFYQGPADISLSADGLLEPSAAPDQEETLENNLSWFKWYPVFAIGMVYKF